jgi:hypothetical protein
MSKIEWTGDPDDDCTARWRGLVLRAEHMSCGDDDCDDDPETCKSEHGERWWWAVSQDGDEFAGSNVLGQCAADGAQARRLAEHFARQRFEVLP